LRMCSHKSAMLQMIGRGLRPPNRPDLVKTDCVVLDFGLSLVRHKLSLIQNANLFPQKLCPGCKGFIDTNFVECPLCGHVPIPVGGGKSTTVEPFAKALEDFEMREVKVLFRNSNFHWCEFAPENYMASGFNAFCGIFLHEGNWCAIGAHPAGRDKILKLLIQGSKQVCVAAASDFMNMHETEATTQDAQTWHNKGVTDKQLAYLPNFKGTRYAASIFLNLKFNASSIETILFKATNKKYSLLKTFPFLAKGKSARSISPSSLPPTSNTTTTPT